jgi:hypothetical protein
MAGCDRTASTSLHQVVADGFSLPGGAQLARIAAQPAGLFHQKHLAALTGHAQGGFHAGHAAAHHQGRLGDRHRYGIERFDEGRLGHGHAHQVLGLAGGHGRIVHVHPGVLIADVGHFEQVLVQAGLADGLLKERFVGARRA